MCDDLRCWYSTYFDTNLHGLLGEVEFNNTIRCFVTEFLQFSIEFLDVSVSYRVSQHLTAVSGCKNESDRGRGKAEEEDRVDHHEEPVEEASGAVVQAGWGEL